MKNLSMKARTNLLIVGISMIVIGLVAAVIIRNTGTLNISTANDTPKNMSTTVNAVEQKKAKGADSKLKVEVPAIIPEAKPSEAQSVDDKQGAVTPSLTNKDIPEGQLQPETEPKPTYKPDLPNPDEQKAEKSEPIPKSDTTPKPSNLKPLPIVPAPKSGLGNVDVKDISEHVPGSGDKF